MFHSLSRRCAVIFISSLATDNRSTEKPKGNVGDKLLSIYKKTIEKTS